MAEEGQAYGYGKRPLWQWVLIYLVVGGLIYAAIYYFYIANKGRYSSNTMYTPPTSVEVSPTVMVSDFFMTQTDAVKGDYLAGPSGMTLYTYDKDTTGVSNCYGGCATTWPPYIARAAASSLPASVTTVNRTDGTIIYAYKGMPVYYYAKDTKSGDIMGDGVGGVWHLVKP